VNKELYGKTYTIPNNILNHLSKYSGNETIGNLINNKNVSYSQLKKIKHRMENGEKSELGEDSFYNWVNHTLNSDRSSIETSKEIRSDAGMENQFIRPHEKNRINNLNRPSKGHNEENSDIKITEALKRINQIMKKII
jgi:uncharacterized FlgJ-related protein